MRANRPRFGQKGSGDKIRVITHRHTFDGYLEYEWDTDTWTTMISQNTCRLSQYRVWDDKKGEDCVYLPTFILPMRPNDG